MILHDYTSKSVEAIRGHSRREIYKHLIAARKNYTRQTEEVIRKGLYDPVFKLLGFEFAKKKSSASAATTEDYLLYTPGDKSKPIAAALTYVMRLLENDDEDTEDATPNSRATEMDDNDEAHQIVDALPRLDASKYDRRRLHRALQEDIDALTEIWHEIEDISIAKDANLQQLKSLLETELRRQKVIVFTYYKDTARYLYQVLMSDDNATWREGIGKSAHSTDRQHCENE